MFSSGAYCKKLLLPRGSYSAYFVIYGNLILIFDCFGPRFFVVLQFLTLYEKVCEIVMRNYGTFCYQRNLNSSD